MEPSGQSSDEQSPCAESISDRLQRATDDMKVLEQLILGGDFPPRLLSDFRDAVDSIRGTARVVQMWVGLQERHGEPYSAMSTMAEDRVRRTAQIVKNLTADLESMVINVETEGLVELYRTILKLQERLSPLVHDRDHDREFDRDHDRNLDRNVDTSFDKFKASSDRTDSEKKKYG